MAEDAFHYDGYLVFTPVLFRVKNEGKNGSSVLDDLFSNLPQFESGNPTKPAEGFERIQLHRHINLLPGVPSEILSEIKNIYPFRYRAEEYSEQEAYVDGQREVVNVRNIESADIFTFNSNIALFRGKQSIVNKAISAIQRARPKDILIETIEFTPDFLSLVYDNTGSIPGSPIIQSKSVSEVQFEGLENISTLKSYSGDIKSEQNEAYQNVPGRHIKYITKLYSIEDTQLEIEIQPGRLHVKAAQGSLSEMTDIERMIYSIYVAKKISAFAIEHDADGFE